MVTNTNPVIPVLGFNVYYLKTGGHLVGSINIEAWVPRAPPHGDSQHFNAN